MSIENETDSSQSAGVEIRRINFNISTHGYDELARLAEVSRQSMTMLIKIGLSLVKLAVEATARGERLVVLDANGKITRELVLPMQ